MTHTPLYLSKARMLRKMKENGMSFGDMSHLWLCQQVASAMQLTGYKAYRFSKECGYNFNITI